jgi:hypothetical protein
MYRLERFVEVIAACGMQFPGILCCAVLQTHQASSAPARASRLFAPPRPEAYHRL